MNCVGVKSDNGNVLDKTFTCHKNEVFNPDRKYVQLNIGMGIVAHTIITCLGFHWRHVVLSKEQNGVQIDYGVYCFSTRAPEMILPIKFMKGFKGRVMKERCHVS